MKLLPSSSETFLQHIPDRSRIPETQPAVVTQPNLPMDAA
jgi:hypothetical protein